MSFTSNWGSKDDEILIEFVRNHEAIYNIKSKNHRKTQLKQNWWREIGEILNKTDSDCSKRWCYIRDYYVRRRGKPGITSGEAAKKRADLLSFLDNVPTAQRGSISNVVDDNSEDSSELMENTHDNSERTQNSEGSIIIENTYNNSEETLCNTQEMEYVICDNNDDKKDDNVKSLNLLKHIDNRNSSQNSLDETDLFFGSMAKIVKKLPRYEQAQLRIQIGSLVGNAELRHISNNSSQSSTIYPRPSTNNSDYYERKPCSF